ncbi:hypothetical protein BJV74DRAFT_787376, partial [Russula compacta]
YVGVASFTVLVWDHLITFSDEVEYIWKGGKGPAVYLFFLNRYLVPLSFIVNLWAYFRKTWSLCSHFVRYEGALNTIGVSVVALMMFLRIRALYPRSLAIQALVLTILCTFVGVNSWLVGRGVREYTVLVTLTLPTICGPIASSTAWVPLIYDTVAIFLTFKGTAKHIRSKGSSQVFRVMLNEGLLYYSVICTVSLVFTLMIIFAPPAVRNITGHLTVTMMSRITIHLKRFAHNPSGVIQQDSNFPSARQGHLVKTIPRPAFAARSGPYSTNVTITRGPLDSSLAASGNESYLAMRTISPVAERAEEPYTQHPLEPLPRASAGGDNEAPGIS